MSIQDTHAMLKEAQNAPRSITKSLRSFKTNYISFLNPTSRLSKRRGSAGALPFIHSVPEDTQKTPRDGLPSASCGYATTTSPSPIKARAGAAALTVRELRQAEEQFLSNFSPYDGGHETGRPVDLMVCDEFRVADTHVAPPQPSSPQSPVAPQRPSRAIVQLSPIKVKSKATVEAEPKRPPRQRRHSLDMGSMEEPRTLPSEYISKTSRLERDLRKLPSLNSSKLSIDELILPPVTCLFEAATKGRADAISALVAPGKSLGINRPNEEGYTPLMLAASVGSEKTVRELLKFGADVSVQHTLLKRTAVHIAALKGHKSVLATLLDHSADPLVEIAREDQYGLTPVFLAQLGDTARHVAAAEFLEALGARKEPRPAAGSSRSTEVIHDSLASLVMTAVQDIKDYQDADAGERLVVHKWKRSPRRPAPKSRVAKELRREMEQNGTWSKLSALTRNLGQLQFGNITM